MLTALPQNAIAGRSRRVRGRPPICAAASARRDRDEIGAAQQRAARLTKRMARRDGTTMLALEQAARVTARAELARLEDDDAADAWSVAVGAWDAWP